MAKLSTVEALIARGNLGAPSQEALDRYARALDSATLRLENMFDTDFLAATGVEEVFHLTPRVRPLQQGGLFFFAGNMFVTGTPVVTWGLMVSDARAVDAEELTVTLVDASRGLFHLAEENFPYSSLVPGYRNRSEIEEFYLELTYNHGFTLPASPGGDPPNDVYQNVPAGLKELAETEALNVLQQMHPCKKEDGEYTQTCLDPYTRKFDRHQGGAYRPIL